MGEHLKKPVGYGKERTALVERFLRLVAQEVLVTRTMRLAWRTASYVLYILLVIHTAMRWPEEL